MSEAVTFSYASSGDIVYYDKTSNTTYVYNDGDIAWTLASTALVWIMIPGVGYLYSGLLRRKNALNQLWLCMVTIGVVSFQWYIFGFSLAFSETGGPFIGDLKHAALIDVLDKPSMGSIRIPSIVFCVYQLMFAAITPMLAIGAIAERGKLGPTIVFIFVWATLVYDPIANWTWNSNGWSAKLGGLDFAGGTPVHISSGTAALAISIYLGKRRGYGTERLAYKPHNSSYVVIGTVFLWFGWFGFNGGSALSANLRAANACIITNQAAAVAGLTWMLWDYRLEKKWSVVGFCSGAIVGLVAITPASGFVGPSASVAFGVIAGTVCNFGTKLKFIFNYDDPLDIFASHTIGGVVGNLLTGLFADKDVAALDGITFIKGGWINHHWVQLGYQAADCCAGFTYSLVATTLILWVMHFIPGCRLRASEEAEIVGLDDAEMGEFAYDYVGIDADLGPKEFDMRAESPPLQEKEEAMHAHA
jgi:Amt family ammonium transporter